MSTIIVTGAGGRAPAIAPKAFPLTLYLAPSDTVESVKNKIAAAAPQFYASRQKLTLKGDKKTLSDASTLKELGFGTNGELDVKDLGPQISWRTVFFIEYLGPLLIHPIFYHFPKLVYGSDVVHSPLQTAVYAVVMGHFIKRELETLFVHRFSHGTMPFFNVFKNSAHYHILSGLFLAFDVYRPAFSATSKYIKGTFRDDPQFLAIFSGLVLFFEFSNLLVHLNLRNLRPAGTKKRAIPFGYGFNFGIACPNYFFESLVWTTVAVATGSYAAWLFNAVAVGQMALWAIKKNKAYKKEFGAAYPKRKAIIPFIL